MWNINGYFFYIYSQSVSKSQRYLCLFFFGELRISVAFSGTCFAKRLLFVCINLYAYLVLFFSFFSFFFPLSCVCDLPSLQFQRKQKRKTYFKPFKLFAFSWLLGVVICYRHCSVVFRPNYEHNFVDIITRTPLTTFKIMKQFQQFLAFQQNFRK